MAESLVPNGTVTTPTSVQLQDIVREDTPNKSSPTQRCDSCRSNLDNQSLHEEPSSVFLSSCGSRVSVFYSDDDPLDRLFHTKRDGRGVCAMKSLGLLPRSPRKRTLADVGVQAELFDEGEVLLANTALRDSVGRLTDVRGVLLKDNTQQKEKLESTNQAMFKAVEKNRALIEELEGKDGEISDLRHLVEAYLGEINILKSAMEENRKQKEQLHKKVEEKDKEVLSLNQTNASLQAEFTREHKLVEKGEMDYAFIQQDRDELLEGLKARDEKIIVLFRRLNKAKTRKDEYKDMYLNNKRSSTDVLKRYLSMLNDVFEEKKVLLKHQAKGPELKEMMATTETYLTAEGEKNKLVDQVGQQELVMEEQRINIEQLQEQLSDLTKCIPDAADLSSISSPTPTESFESLSFASRSLTTCPSSDRAAGSSPYCAGSPYSSPYCASRLITAYGAKSTPHNNNNI